MLCPNPEFYILASISTTLNLIFFCWFFYKIVKQPRDIYHLKLELFGCTVLFVLDSFVYILFYSFLPSRTLINDVNVLIGCFLFCGLDACVVVMPTILTFSKKKTILECEVIKSLKDVLENEEYLKLFRKYIIKELSIENIIFYERVENLKKHKRIKY